jgi:hypothetical protein
MPFFGIKCRSTILEPQEPSRSEAVVERLAALDERLRDLAALQPARLRDTLAGHPELQQGDTRTRPSYLLARTRY